MATKKLIVIPTYNEAMNIEPMIRSLFSLYPDIHLLIVEDNSPDGTASIVKRLMHDFSNLFIVERKGKLGLGTAYIAGFKWALERDYDYILEMDCDFSHDPKQVSDLLGAALSFDVVIGSRYIDGGKIVNWPLKRRLLSSLASLYTRLITGLPIRDASGGFKCFTRSALLKLDLDSIISKGYSFQLELNYKAWLKGLSIKEVPITFSERREGISKMNAKIIFEALMAVLRLKIKKISGSL